MQWEEVKAIAADAPPLGGTLSVGAILPIMMEDCDPTDDREALYGKIVEPCMSEALRTLFRSCRTAEDHLRELRKTMSRIKNEDAALLAKSRAAIEQSRELLRQADNLLRDGSRQKSDVEN